jgi:terminal uridylyltransferase
MPPVQNLHVEKQTIDGNDVHFFDDLELLPHVWQTQNSDNVGELLIGFFLHFARDFNYHGNAVSIRSASGLLAKDFKGWHIDVRSLAERRRG